MLLQEVADSAQVSEEGSMEEDAEDEVPVNSEQVIQHWPFFIYILFGSLKRLWLLHSVPKW